MPSTLEENKALVRRFSNEFKNKANHGIVDELMTPDFQHHFKDPRLPKGREGMKMVGRGVVVAFPDVHANIQDLIAEGDRVVERTNAKGTHKGEFNGVPATGRPVAWSELHVYRIVNGKIAELWSEIDFLGMMMQLGAIPAP
jgi:predicted ester cyclase